MMKRRTVKLLSAAAFGLGIFGILHQELAEGYCWNWEQFWHHESLIAMCFVSAVSLLVGEYAANQNHAKG